MITRMKQVRLRRHLSQTKLGAAADLSTSDVSKIESGRFQPYPGQLKRLARALKLKPQELLEAVDEHVG
jgi:transcriptional regulator with XRE-family HTH domain